MASLDDHQRATLAQAADAKTPRMRDNPYRQCRPYTILDIDKSQVVIESYVPSIRNPRWSPDGATRKFDVFRTAELTMFIYLKIPGDTGTGVCLGSGKVIPSISMTDASSVKWLHLRGGSGKVGVGFEYRETKGSLTRYDFRLAATVAEYETHSILLAQKNDAARFYAVKLFRKSRLDPSANVVHNVRAEMHSCLDTDSSFVASLYTTFEDEQTFRLVSPFASGGYLFYHLQMERRFDTARARFYAAEIACALEYLHELDILGQGLWPRNFLLDSRGHVVLADFSLHESPTQA
jgi:serum/glucocorticoid-regulated kinase 2